MLSLSSRNLPCLGKGNDRFVLLILTGSDRTAGHDMADQQEDHGLMFIYPIHQ